MFSSLRPLSSLSLSRQFSQSSFFSSSQQQKTKREWGDKTREIQEERREKGKEGDEGVALYVHWPFCSSICNYCDFNRYLQNEHTYSVELETEMAQVKKKKKKKKKEKKKKKKKRKRESLFKLFFHLNRGS